VRETGGKVADKATSESSGRGEGDTQRGGMGEDGGQIKSQLRNESR
jgi:hypothetical protein